MFSSRHQVNGLPVEIIGDITVSKIIIVWVQT